MLSAASPLISALPKKDCCFVASGVKASSSSLTQRANTSPASVIFHGTLMLVLKGGVSVAEEQ